MARNLFLSSLDKRDLIKFPFDIFDAALTGGFFMEIQKMAQYEMKNGKRVLVRRTQINGQVPTNPKPAKKAAKPTPIKED